MALMPCNTTVGWHPNTLTSSTFTVTSQLPVSLYLIDCMHCGEKFVTKPRKSVACIQSLETCWDVECPKCSQEIRLCLHECKCDCEHVLDCLLIGISDKVMERALQLEFEKGAEVHRYEPYSPPSQYPWDQLIGGSPNITWGGSSAVEYTTSPYSISTGGTYTVGQSNITSNAVTISFKDRLKSILKAKLGNASTDE